METLFGSCAPSAVFSPCGLYRYLLTRTWDPNLPRVCWVMLNPSTATAEHDDPTIRRCIDFSKRWGYGSLSVVNLFAYRTPYPQKLRYLTDPIGPDNDKYILSQLLLSDLVIVAWGAGADIKDHEWRDASVLRMVETCYCLGVCVDESPRHPLYIRADVAPILYQKGET